MPRAYIRLCLFLLYLHRSSGRYVFPGAVNADMKKIFYMSLLTAVSVAVLSSCIIDRIPSDAADLKPGDRLPEFSVKMSNGKTVSDRTLEGRLSIIVFFHTGCGDCREELPVMQRFWLEYGNTVNVVCISRAESRASVEAYWEANGLTLPYSAQEDSELYYRFAKSVIPRVYVADRELVIRQVFDDDPVASYEDIVSAIDGI